MVGIVPDVLLTMESVPGMFGRVCRRATAIVPRTNEPAFLAPERVPLTLYLLLGTVPLVNDPALDCPTIVPTEMLLGSLTFARLPRVTDPAETWAETVPTLIVLGSLEVEIVPLIFETIESVPGMLGRV